MTTRHTHPTLLANMQAEQVIELLKSTDAILSGHFQLSSGLHSDTYVQCALVLQYPDYAARLGAALAVQFAATEIDAVVSPALGGLIIGQETARGLSAGKGTPGGVPAMFVERDSTGALTLRRGFRVSPGQRILVVEDVWTTGGSTAEAMRIIEQHGGRVVGAGAIINRSIGPLHFPVLTKSLVQLQIASYAPPDCPQCAAGNVSVKPGSRFAKPA
ncbi:MAG TPA: orotate phosphoribosyltransferase [Candidatus Acidoferrales bacterium]|nr:orotate phosphoribosyltransferase [Candidatus Acidoferrales bacterium]